MPQRSTLTTIQIHTYKVNEKITAPELRVVDEVGKNIGVFSRDEALRLAQEKGLDLVEITATAKPPVAKLISFDKFRYQKEKEFKKQRAGQKSQTLKQIRISVRAAMNDLLIKARKIDAFLQDDHAVEIQMVLRGREKGNKPFAEEKLKGFLKLITVAYITITPIKFGGRGPMTTLTKDNHGKEKHSQENKNHEKREAHPPTDGN